MGLAVEAAERLCIPHVVFNQRLYGHAGLTLSSANGTVTGALRVQTDAYRLNDFRGVYARTVEPDSLLRYGRQRTIAPDPHEVGRLRCLHEGFQDWLDVADARVANRPAAMYSNNSKPYQLQLIQAQGWSVPPTLVTNDPAALAEFRARHGRIIYKSISGIRSIVSEWTAGDAAQLSRLDRLPTQFQALISGTNVRVHVVAERVFATEICSDALDYRYASREGRDICMRPLDLPPEIEERCIRLTRSLGLVFSGIDLKRDLDGCWYCFEVNPSPGYSYFQDQAGQPIADALVSCLAGLSG
jgi:hypothetical protein